MKVAIIGGSFDPPTYAHLAMGTIVESYVDSVVYVPNGNCPLKGDHFADKKRRLRMIRLALWGEKSPYEESSYEVDQDGVTYTIDTLRHFEAEGVDPVLVIGTDCFQRLHEWKDFEEILLNYEVFILHRDGYTMENDKLIGVPKRKLKLLDGVGGVSSTMIRERIKLGLSCKHLIPDEIIDYIKRSGLYVKH